MDKIFVTMHLNKVTKGAVRYEEDQQSDTFSIGTLYIRKTALPEPAPTKIKVLVEKLDG